MQVENGSQSYERHEYVEAADLAQNTQDPIRPWFSPESVLRFVALIASIVIAGFLLWYFFRLVMYLLAGFLIAYLTRPLVDRLEGAGVGRVQAILISFIALLGITAILGTFLVPFFAAQISDIGQRITLENVTRWTASIEASLRARIPIIQEGSLIDGIDSIASTLFQEQRFPQFIQSILGVFTDIFYAVLVIPFVTFFFLRDANKIRRKGLSLVPNRYFEVTLSVIEKIETNIGRYLRGLLLQCLYVGIVATIFLSFTDLENALLVGLFTGIANSIPYFGPFMGLIAGSLAAVAQTNDFTLIPGICVAMLLTQALDNVLFQPLIFSRAARMHPLVIMCVVLIGAQMAGIAGMLLAIPLATTLWVTIEQVLWSVRNYRILKTAR